MKDAIDLKGEIWCMKCKGVCIHCDDCMQDCCKRTKAQVLADIEKIIDDFDSQCLTSDEKEQLKQKIEELA